MSLFNTIPTIQQLHDAPALKPPENITPNFDHPPNRNGLAMSIISVSAALMTVSFLIRAYTRLCCVRKIRLEDYLGLLALPFFIAGTWKLAMIPKGIGFFVNQWNLHLYDLEGFLKSYILVTTLYCVTMMLIKASILLEWIHLFIPRSTRNAFFWTCCVMIGVDCWLYITTIAITNSACKPREKMWHPYMPGSCIAIFDFNIIITTLHLAFDLIMLSLPHRTIWKLLLSTRQKIGVSTIFSVGLLTCACAAGRVVSAVDLKQSQDTTYSYSRHLIWGISEAAATTLIFTASAIPIVFRGPGPVHRLGTLLQAKISNYYSRKTLSLTSTRSHSRPDTTHQETPVNQTGWIDENSEVQLTELEPAKTTKYPYEGDSMHDDRVILRTTQIDITTSEKGETSNERIHQQEHPRPWLDSESE
ncbi:hypothetical protein F4804DRAFT_218524 [Jackrogersella minutella]|nr:hypothetical protein F4804DRAFT_218524 [Jackrogersella minutella]